MDEPRPFHCVVLEQWIVSLHGPHTTSASETTRQSEAVLSALTTAMERLRSPESGPLDVEVRLR